MKVYLFRLTEMNSSTSAASLVSLVVHETLIFPSVTIVKGLGIVWGSAWLAMDTEPVMAAE